jgi:hypothetical protein
MEKTKNEFLLEIEKFVKEWIPETLDKYIDKFPEIEQSKTQEELIALRREGKRLSLSLAPQIRELFANDKIWWHKNRNFSDRDHYKEIDNIMPDEVRFLLGELGILLNSYDFLPMMVVPFFGFISGKDGENELYFKYLDPIHWSRNSKRLMDNYWEDYKWAVKLQAGPIGKSA